MKGAIRIALGLNGIFVGVGTIEFGSMAIGLIVSVISLGILAWGANDAHSQS